jgi:hypothetical protein
MELDREFAQQFSITPKIENHTEKYSFSKQGAIQYFKDHQFTVIGYTWLGLVGLSLAYNFSRPQITMAQKMINARLVAQSGAMLGIVAVAALQVKQDKRAPVKDLYFERAIGGIPKDE